MSEKQKKKKKTIGMKKALRAKVPGATVSRLGIWITGLSLLAIALNYLWAFNWPLMESLLIRHLPASFEGGTWGALTLPLPIITALMGLAVYAQGKSFKRQAASEIKRAHMLAKKSCSLLEAILQRQAGVSQDRAEKNQRENLRRARAVSLLHELLSKGGGLSVAAPEYFRKLSHEAAGIIGPDKARLSMDLAPIRLRPKTALACGMILSELVSNSLGSAFIEVDNPEIQVFFGMVGKRAAELRVSDNGVGMPTRLDLDRLATTGLKTVSMLASQLKGTIKTKVSEGTTVSVSFPL